MCFYFIILKKVYYYFICNIDDCSQYTDCYNCTASFYFYNYTLCEWNNGQCRIIKESTAKYFWEPFESCTDFDSINTRQKYCGDENLGSENHLTVSIPKVDNRYGTLNLLCKYIYNNMGKDSSISVTFRLDPLSFERDAALYIYVKFSDGTTAVKNINQENYSVSIGPASVIELYLAFLNSLETQPFNVSFQSQESGKNKTLIIVIVTVIIACILCAASIYFFSKRLAKKRDIQNQINREIEFVDTEGNRGHRNGLSQEELMKIRRIAQIKYVLSNIIKPTLYQKDIHSFNFNCTICLEDFKSDSIVGKTQCNHVFHYNCLKTWLHQNLLDPKCPNCNSHILSELNKDNTPLLTTVTESSMRRVQFQIPGNNSIQGRE